MTIATRKTDMIAHPPGRWLYLFFSGRNNDRAPSRQMTVSFFSGCNNDRAPARQTTVSFFSGRNNDCAPTRQRTKKLTQHHNCMVLQVHRNVQPKPISRQNQKLTQQHNWKKGSSSPREAWAGSSSPRKASVFVPLSLNLSVSKG